MQHRVRRSRKSSWYNAIMLESSSGAAYVRTLDAGKWQRIVVYVLCKVRRFEEDFHRFLLPHSIHFKSSNIARGYSDADGLAWAVGTRIAVASVGISRRTSAVLVSVTVTVRLVDRWCGHERLHVYGKCRSANLVTNTESSL